MDAFWIFMSVVCLFLNLIHESDSVSCFEEPCTFRGTTGCRKLKRNLTISQDDCCHGNNFGYYFYSEELGMGCYECNHCNEYLARTDGGWSEWSQWTYCSKTCGGGTRKRFRQCNNPIPTRLGKDCQGKAEDIETCNEHLCRVNGAWSSWNEWSDCSKTCGSGYTFRRRTCDNPPPKNGGKNCPGDDVKEKPCFLGNCPINGGWSDWSDWTKCTKECGGGTKKRSRRCDNPSPANFGKDCEGDDEEIKDCNEHHCPVDGAWSVWSEWSSCSVTCGNGETTRRRKCDNPSPKHGGENCPGDDTYKKRCSFGDCPINGGWSDWSQWSKCTKECSGGTKHRSRKCDNPLPANFGKDCEGDFEENENCNTHQCIVDGAWSAWSEWSSCSVTCGNGETTRRRKCDNPSPKHGGENCPGDDTYKKRCSFGDCPINGGWSDWSQWSKCTKECGGGTKHRSRRCDNPLPANFGKDCEGDVEEIENCNTDQCIVDGGWSAWSEWSSCSVTCGYGAKTRHRKCDNPSPKDGGENCPGDDTYKKRCYAGECLVDDGWSQWGQWSDCSVTCGLGIQTRKRDCTYPPRDYGGKPCPGEDAEGRICHLRICPIDDGGSQWGQWSDCSVTCGLGFQTRKRDCTNPPRDYGGIPCPDEDAEGRTCHLRICPIHGGWSKWSEWSECSTTCGRGTKSEKRTCTNPIPEHGGNLCHGDDTNSLICDEKPCPEEDDCMKQCITKCQTETGSGYYGEKHLEYRTLFFSDDEDDHENKLK